jgi:sortase A
MHVVRRLAALLVWLGAGISLAAAGGLLLLATSFVVPGMRAIAFRSPAPDQTYALVVPAGGGRAAPPESEPPAAPVTPAYLSVPKLGLYAPVVPIAARPVDLDGQTVSQLEVPNAYAAGWSVESAPVGVPGNTILVGHNNAFGDVFRDLDRLAAGDEIVVEGESANHVFAVAEVARFAEQGLSLIERLNNGRWLKPTADERLTLITCWPYFTNSHRLVVVAMPVN